jgi:RNA polymerase sigma-70 factor (ECF subfamily)
VPRGARLINVTVADITLLGPAGAAARQPASMLDATFDLETTRLAARARSGDAEAFNALVELHHRSARRVALAALGNLADADEAVQEACLTAWRRIDRLEEPAAFRAWLLRITWRKALDRRRSVASWINRVRRHASDEHETVDDIAGATHDAPDTALLSRERDRIVAQLIRSLPSRLRDPFLLAASGEHRYEDIATLLGIPLGTVKWRMVEAKRVLREKLQRMGFGEPV